LPNNSLTVPPKNWWPKAKNNYKPINYEDIDDDLFVLEHFGKTMKRSPTWTHRPRSSFLAELTKYVTIDATIDPTIK